jgi:hypothetical protein
MRAVSCPSAVLHNPKAAWFGDLEIPEYAENTEKARFFCVFRVFRGRHEEAAVRSTAESAEITKKGRSRLGLCVLCALCG